MGALRAFGPPASKYPRVAPTNSGVRYSNPPYATSGRVFIGNELVTGRVEGAARCDGRYRAATGLAARHSDILRAVDANHAAIAKAETVFARRRCRSLAKTASCNENNRGVAQPVLSEPTANTRYRTGRACEISTSYREA